jgi:trans-2,3-dihydro-3-hydroxyanthranilate isomerase
MTQLPFHTLDVFTDRVFGGNPLAVFPDATHLSTPLMQRIAREMNLSETVFLGPPGSGGDARVRIFTPGVEVPFAGHPTVGAAVFLAGRMDARPEEGTVELVLEENVGPVPVEVRLRSGEAVSARFTTAVRPEHRPAPLGTAELAALVGLEEAEIGAGGGDGADGGTGAEPGEAPPPAGPGRAGGGAEAWPALVPEAVSCGLPYLVVPVRSLAAVRRAALDLAAWRRLLSGHWADKVYLVCPEAEGEGVDVHVRMFAPGAGVHEDPATGSAAAALGGYLAAADGRREGELAWTVEQGLEMGRPSLLRVEAERRAGETVAVRVGGSAVPVLEGSMRIPHTA